MASNNIWDAENTAPICSVRKPTYFLFYDIFLQYAISSFFNSLLFSVNISAVTDDIICII